MHANIHTTMLFSMPGKHLVRTNTYYAKKQNKTGYLSAFQYLYQHVVLAVLTHNPLRSG